MESRLDQRPEPVIVTGTGRCGSTLVSNLLREHPQVLSLSEFFNHMTDMYRLTASAFPEGNISADQFWTILSSRHPVNGLLVRNGVSPKEVLYPSGGSARFTGETGIPAILLTTLPHLTDEPDALYDEVAEAVAAFPDGTAGEHYIRLFEWLCKRFDKGVWAERSGGSLILAGQFMEHFPNAKYVHIVRDGRDTALSMTRHNGFRMAAIVMVMGFTLGLDPYSLDDLSKIDLEQLPEDLQKFLPDRFDKEAFREYDIPPSLFGSYWSDEMERGIAGLAPVPQDRILHLFYEDLLASPRESVTRLMDFIGPQYTDEAWVERCVARIKAPTSSWTSLPEDEQKQLVESCERGFAALASQGIVPGAGLSVGSAV